MNEEQDVPQGGQEAQEPGSPTAESPPAEDKSTVAGGNPHREEKQVKKLKDPILVPVDFSPHSEAALVHAGMLAKCTGNPLLVLHVVHDPGEMPGYYAKMTKKKTLARMEDLAAEMMGEFLGKVHKHNPGLKQIAKAETLLVSGLPVTRILQVIERTEPSMVVMGSKGQTGLKHLLMGSIAENIVQLAPVPVTIVKAKAKK